MASFKTILGPRRANGTRNVVLRVTHNRVTRHIATHLTVDNLDLNAKGEIRDINILESCAELERLCRKACNDLGYRIKQIGVDELVSSIKIYLEGKERFRLDFYEFAEVEASKMQKRTGETYRGAMRALKRYTNRDKLDISEIDSYFVQGFISFLQKEPSQRGSNRKFEATTEKEKGDRAVSKYVACLRALHNRAKLQYNDEDRGIIKIPYSPFKSIKVKQPSRTRKRALSIEEIQALIDLKPKSVYEELARDCFILSFALIGMNSIDMYDLSPTSGSVLIYNRAKTKDRREDKAEMQVRIEGCVEALIMRYRGKNKFFDFSERYTTSENFNRSINKYLKRIDPKLEFYSARHSWATIAYNNVGVDKYTIHEALNHIDPSMRVTDIYIERDWRKIWEANEKVLDLFDWTNIGYDVL